MPSVYALGIFSAKYFIKALQEDLRIFPNCIFTEGSRRKSAVSKAPPSGELAHRQVRLRGSGPCQSLSLWERCHRR